jgi:hypothetical protein
VQLSQIGSGEFKVQSSRFKVQGSRSKVHSTKQWKGGSGVPPLFFHGQEAGRLFHFAGKKMGAKRREQEISPPVALLVLRNWQMVFHFLRAPIIF